VRGGVLLILDVCRIPSDSYRGSLRLVLIEEGTLSEALSGVAVHFKRILARDLGASVYLQRPKRDPRSTLSMVPHDSVRSQDEGDAPPHGRDR
jgi:hypothetical protein